MEKWPGRSWDGPIGRVANICMKRREEQKPERDGADVLPKAAVYHQCTIGLLLGAVLHASQIRQLVCLAKWIPWDQRGFAAYYSRLCRCLTSTSKAYLQIATALMTGNVLAKDLIGLRQTVYCGIKVDALRRTSDEKPRARVSHDASFVLMSTSASLILALVGRVCIPDRGCSSPWPQ